MVEIRLLGSGSRGNCALIRCGHSALLVDAGFSARQLAGRLEAVGQDPADIDAILVTHEHLDHIGGLKRFTKKFPTTVMTNMATHAAIQSSVSSPSTCELFLNGATFDVGRFRITPFSVPHDAVDPVGFVLEAEGMSIGYATDLGHVTAGIRARLCGCQALVLESNYDREMLEQGPYPWFTKQRVASALGHLSNDHAAAELLEIVDEGTSSIILAHLSSVNNAPALAKLAAEDALRRAGRHHVHVEVSTQDEPTAAVCL